MGDVPAGGSDDPTNIYFLAQYGYQISPSAAPMADHELGVLASRSGHVWFNACLFNDVPGGSELATRDAWWRVVDASAAVRFLLGWSVSLYRTAVIRGTREPEFRDFIRVLRFDPDEAESSQSSIRLWSDIICDLTAVFAPHARLIRQVRAMEPAATYTSLSAVSPIHSPKDGPTTDQLHRILAAQNNCPAVLIQRSLAGNLPIATADDYIAFTEAIMRDIPRLQLQRTIAMRGTPHVARAPSLWRLHL